MSLQKKDILNLIIRLSNKTYAEIGAAIKKNPEEVAPDNKKKNYTYAQKLLKDDISLYKFLQIVEICDAKLFVKTDENCLINISEINLPEAKCFYEVYIAKDIKKLSSSNFISILEENKFTLFVKIKDTLYKIDEAAISEMSNTDFYDSKRKQIKEKYLAGMSVVDIAAEYNCSRAYIFIILKQTGCTLRNDKGVKSKITKEQFYEEYEKVESGLMSVEDLKQKLDIKKDTYYRYRKMYLQEKK